MLRSLKRQWSKADSFKQMGKLVRRLLLCFLLLQAGTAFAQSTSDEQVIAAESKAESLKVQLKAAQTISLTDSLTDEDLVRQKGAIESIRLESVAEQAKLNAPLSEVKEQLAKIGPPPTDGQTETAAIAAQRRLLGTRQARLAAAQKQLELLTVEAVQSTAKITVLQRDQFFSRIFKADRSVLNPKLWIETIYGTGDFVSHVASAIYQSLVRTNESANLFGLLLFPAGIGAGYGVWIFAWRLIRRRFQTTSQDPVNRQMDGLRRLWRVIYGLFALIVVSVLIVILIRASLDVANLLTPEVQKLLRALDNILTPTIINGGLAYLLCAPRRPEARLIAVDDAAARLLPILIGAASFAFAVGGSFADLTETLNLPVTLIAGQTAISAIAMIVLIGLILLLIKDQARKNQSEGSSYFLTWFVQFLPILWLLLGVAIVALILGYISLAYFVSGNIIDTALFIVVLALFHYLADAVAEAALSPVSKLGQMMRDFLGLSERGIARISLLFRTSVDVLLVLVAIPVMFVIWTVTWIDMSSAYKSLIEGFRIGNISLSPWGIIMALLVLAIGVIITRSLTGWLQRRVMAETSLDKGVQDSVRTATSYLGYLIAVVLALAAAGIDFSNIALIAGALGVGIGLGLQSIVNNFVSGLILLVERPIRVGDWVVTNAGEGIVKKINVRSTEIETFDNCTVIMPNSNLITESVRNWTHRDTVGRFAVNLIVQKDCKPAQVSELMKSIAKAHPKVLRYPEPTVAFSRFVPLGYEFDLKGHVADVFEAARVASDIRFEIAEVFAKNKIVIATQ